MNDLKSEIQYLQSDLDNNTLEPEDITPTLCIEKEGELRDCKDIQVLTDFVNLCQRLTPFFSDNNGNNLKVISSYLKSVAKIRRLDLIIKYILRENRELENCYQQFTLYRDLDLNFLGSPEFSGKEFENASVIENLCRIIINEQYTNVPPQNTLPIDWINGVLKRPDFHLIWLEKQKNKSGFPNKNIQQLIKDCARFSSDDFSQLTVYQQKTILFLNRRLLETTYTKECPKTSFLSYLEHLGKCLDNGTGLFPSPVWYLRVEQSIGYVEPLFVWFTENRSEEQGKEPLKFHFNADKAIYDVGINAQKAAFSLLTKNHRTGFQETTVNISIKDFPCGSEEQSLEKQSVGSIGLALTTAIFYNYQIYCCKDSVKQEMRLQINNRLHKIAFTGAVKKDGTISSVKGVKEKANAALYVHMDTIFIPGKDKRELKGSIPNDFFTKSIRSEKRVGKVINAINNQLYFYPRLFVSLFITVITTLAIYQFSFFQFTRDLNLIFHKTFYELREASKRNSGGGAATDNSYKKLNNKIILVLTNEAIYDKKKEKEADIELRSKLIDFLNILNEPEYKPKIIGIDYFFQNRYSYEEPYRDVDFKLAYKISQSENKVIIPFRLSVDGVKEFPYREMRKAVINSSGYTNIPHSDDVYDGLRVDLWRTDKEKKRYFSFSMKMLINLFKTDYTDMKIFETYDLRKAWNIRAPFGSILSNKYTKLRIKPDKNIFFPMDENDTVHINYSVPLLKGSDWEYYHLNDIIRSYEIIKSGETDIKPNVPLYRFKNRVVLVGGHYDPNQDRFEQPLGEIAGVEIFANFLKNALTKKGDHYGDFIIRVSKGINTFFLFLFNWIIAFMTIYYGLHLKKTAIFFLLSTFTVTYLLFAMETILFDPVEYVMAIIFQLFLIKGFYYVSPGMQEYAMGLSQFLNSNVKETN